MEGSLKEKVAIITGASRGIGKAVAKRLAKEGVRVVLAAKTAEPHPKLPGTIFDAKREIEKEGGCALAVPTDVRFEDQIQRLVERTVEYFGRLDIVIHNAGAIFWENVENTPPKRLDLVWQVNCRAAFLLCHFSLPYLKRQGGHILLFSPPIDFRLLPGKVAYFISKFGMTMLTLGLSQEVKSDSIAVNSLWPATLIESQATRHFRLGEPRHWRKPEIVADAVCCVVRRPPSEVTGQVLIDEEVLREEGVEDFSSYNCAPDGEPIRIVDTPWEIPKKE